MRRRHNTTNATVAKTNARFAETYARFRPGHEYMNFPTAGTVGANSARGAAPGAQACFLFLPSSIHSGVPPRSLAAFEGVTASAGKSASRNATDPLLIGDSSAKLTARAAPRVAGRRRGIGGRRVAGHGGLTVDNKQD